MSSLLDVIQRHFDGNIMGHVHIPARAAHYGEWGSWVAPSVREALDAQGAGTPWIHQAQAADALHEGCNVVLATGTGSGKSLAAWVPALSMIESARDQRVSLASVSARPTVLYLSPTKALAADQEHNLAALARAVNPRIGIATVDGDSERETRCWAQDHADIVLSNPDFIHHAVLGRHERWTRLLRGLSIIVIDEFHSYRGVFGSHVALVIRRLLRLAASYGASPRIIFLSATSSLDTAEQFLGSSFGDVVTVTDDGSPSGARDILAVRCREVPDETALGDAAEPSEGASSEDESAGLESTDIKRRSATTEAAELTALLVENEARVLTFVRSRRGTERVSELAHEHLSRNAPHLEGTVAAYRGGYLPEERRELEKRLRSGDLRALATTSALELGIDIPALDAVVVTGWPGTHASFQQQIGRAGRAGANGLAIFVGRDNPLDQYLLSHPDSLTSTPESGAIDTTNPWILPGHLAAAAGELALTADDAAIFSLPDTSLFEHMEERQMLVRRPRGWFWNPAMKVSPHSLVDIRGSGTTVAIIDADDGALLGTVDSARADATVHPGAIYVHQGITYEVESFSDDLALVKRHRGEEIRTFPRDETSVEIVRTDEDVALIDGTWSRGIVRVRSRVVGYDIRRVRDGMFIDHVPLTMPMREFDTAGTWLTLTESATRQAVVSEELPGALHGAEHMMIALLPLLVTCDRWDLGGLSTAAHPDTGRPTIIVHDSLPGGSGCAYRGFAKGRQWLDATFDTLSSCPCESGCPKCVQSPKCGNNNSPLSKAGARDLTKLALRNFPRDAQMT